MSIYTNALNESFAIENAEFEMDESINREMLNESMWDQIAPIVGGETEEPIEENLQEDLLNSLEKDAKEDIEESLKESIEKYGLTPSSVIDMYENLLESNVPKDEAKKKVLEAERGIKEHLMEENTMTRKERLERDRKNHLKRCVEQFRIAENFTLDEALTEEKLKYHTEAIKVHAVRNGIPSAQLKEALIEGIN